MYQIPIFKAEVEAGLADKVRASASVAYASLADVEVSPRLPDAVKAKLLKSGRAKADAKDFDLFYLKSCLVSTVWNKNDDVFTKEETWPARATPEDKPFNYEHDFTDIIGHITSNYVVDAQGNVIAETSALDEIPDLFHVITGAVLYRYGWPEQGQQERMDQIIADIHKGKKFVSMEAYFRNFCYAMVEPDGVRSVVARTDATAFLTKHLRAYGGDGVYEGRKVGRLLQNITFSGKGLVDRPANPDSEIFLDCEPFKASASKIFPPAPELGYSKITANKERKSVATEIMIETLQKQVADLQVQLRENDTKEITKAKEKAETQVSELTKKLTEQAEANTRLAEGSKTVIAELDATKAKLTEAEKTLADVNKKLADIESAKRRSDRVATATDRLGLPKEKAEKLVDSFAALDDKSFTTAIETQAELVAQAKPKAEAPKDPEVDPAEKNATAKTLETATPNKDASLASGKTEAGVEKVRAEVMDFLSAFLTPGAEDTQ